MTWLYALGPLGLSWLLVAAALAWRGSRLRRVDRSHPVHFRPSRLAGSVTRLRRRPEVTL